MAGYTADLAYVHDLGFGEFASNAAPGLLKMFRRNGIRDGLVVDLGCGTGIWAAELLRAGYDVLGIDISPAMIRIARQRAPEAKFQVGSLLDVPIPKCAAVTAMGECLNYAFDPANSRRELNALFRRVRSALAPGGLFIFDVAEPGQVADPRGKRIYGEGEDWAVLVELHEDRKRHVLTRRITTFRKSGKLYRRIEETHHLRLYRAAELAEDLAKAGFEVRMAARYGRCPLPPGHTALIAACAGRT